MHDNISFPILIDFNNPKISYRRKSKKELIAKAMGLKTTFTPFILDMTAGLGRDAFILASLGCPIILIERFAPLYQTLKTALEHALQNPNTKNIIERMQLIFGDSIQYLQNTKQIFDVIYLDPMFPEKKKTAASKKEITLLKKLIPYDPDNELQLFKTAIKYAKKRVVIKRPRHAKFMNNQKPDIQFNGKSCRFDVYLTSF